MDGFVKGSRCKARKADGRGKPAGLPDIGRLGEPPLPFATTKAKRNAADGPFTKPSKFQVLPAMRAQFWVSFVGPAAIKAGSAEDLETLTQALISLHAENDLVDLVRQAKAMKKNGMANVIRDEYFVYTKGENYKKMEKVAGKVVD